MDAIILFLYVAAGFLVLALLALGWGVDSRESMIDDRRR